MFQTSFFAVGLKTSEWTVSRKKQKVGPDTEEAGRNKTKQEHTQHQRSKITLRFLFCVYKYSRKLLYLYGVCVLEGAEVTYPRWPEFLGGSMSWSEPQRDGADGARVPPMVLKPCLLLYLAWLTLVEVGRIGEPNVSTCKFNPRCSALLTWSSMKITLVPVAITSAHPLDYWNFDLCSFLTVLSFWNWLWWTEWWTCSQQVYGWFCLRSVLACHRVLK